MAKKSCFSKDVRFHVVVSYVNDHFTFDFFVDTLEKFFGLIKYYRNRGFIVNGALYETFDCVPDENCAEYSVYKNAREISGLSIDSSFELTDLPIGTAYPVFGLEKNGGYVDITDDTEDCDLRVYPVDSLTEGDLID